MNYFFHTSYNKINSKLTISKYKNSGERKENLLLLGAFCESNSWRYYLVPDEYDDYYVINSDLENKDHIFFYLDKSNLPSDFTSEYLLKPSDFTSTSPAFRANLEVSMQNGGFSSYQAEFPHRMSQINGSMVSSAGNLINLQNSSNLVFVRSIYNEPILSKFDLYIWDEDDDAPLGKETLSVNSTNVVVLDSYLENSKQGNVGLFADGFLCIPIFLSYSRNGQMSFEHTHPPHENLCGNDRIALVNNYRKQTYEKVIKKIFS